MLRRLLNIASIVCLVVCVALMAMWVRSYQLSYGQQANVAAYHDVGTARGRLITCSVPFTVAGTMPNAAGGELFVIYAGTRPDERFGLEGSVKNHGFGFWRSPPPAQISILMLPFWFLVLTSGLLAMIFRLRWPLRFNLRSLFIATTLLAVVLGMIAWLDRAWIGK